MKTGICVRHVIANHIRIDLDDHGYGNVEMFEDEAHSWVLYRDGNLVGSAKYDLDHIIIEIKP